MAFGRNKDEETGSLPGVFSSSAKGSEMVLGKNCKVVGTLQLAGSSLIDGRVEGEINSQDKLVIGETAEIQARITGADIVVRGSVHGDITATKRILLEKTAKVAGNIQAPTIGIEEGVLFEGKASTGSRQAASKTVTPINPVTAAPSTANGTNK